MTADLDELAKVWPPLGEPCHVPNFRYPEWRTVQLFFAGITYRPGLVPHVDIWLAEKWPPEHPGHITDGFVEADVVFDNWQPELRTARAALEVTDSTERLQCVRVADADLVDGESYLVQSKHGMIEGRWEAASAYFVGYYWRDITFWGEAYTVPALTAAINPNGEAK